MPEGVAFGEHTPRARCEIPIRQIPLCHPRIQPFGGLAGRRDVAGKGSQNDTNLEVEGQARTTEPNSRRHLWRIEPEVTQVSTQRTLSEDMATQHDIFFGFALRPSAEDVDPLEVQEERRRRVGRAQDEELHWANITLVLKGEFSSLGYKAARKAWKMADRFVLIDDDLLHCLGENRRWGKERMNETILRLVVPTTMVQDVLQSCHDSLEGGHQGIVRTFHRVKADYYWMRLYADVERHVSSCRDLRRVEAAYVTWRERLSDPDQLTSDSANPATKFVADLRALAKSDLLQDLVNSPESDMFTNGEPDKSTLTPVFDRRSFVDDICFGEPTFGNCLTTLSRLLARFAECRISINFTKRIFVQPALDFLSHEVSQHGIRANSAKLTAMTELPFPTPKMEIQGFLGALNYYSRFIQNMAVHGMVVYQLKDADFADGGDLAAAKLAFDELKMKVANAPILRHFYSAREVHIMLFANAWALTNEVNDHPAEKEVLVLLHILKVGHTLFAGKTLHVYTLFSTLEWLFNSKALFGRAVSFAVLLSPYHLKVKRIREHDAAFAQLIQATFIPHIGLDESLSHLVPPSKHSATVRLIPELLYAQVLRDFVGYVRYVLSFDGSANTEKYGGYDSSSWILWSLPSWDIVIAATAHLSSTTVNIAEYTGLNVGVMAALERGLTDLIIVGDSRLAIEQSMRVMACKKVALPLELTHHKTLTDQCATSMSCATITLQLTRLLLKHWRVKWGAAGGLQFEFPRAPIRVRRVEDQAEVKVSEGRIPDATDIDPAVVQAERRRRIAKAQDEGLRWTDLKALLRGELDSLIHRRAQNASKIADSFVLSEDYYQGQRRRRAELDWADISIRLAVPTTMVDEVLHSCHNSIEGGHQGIVRTFHRVKPEFYWVELYADLSKHIQTCEDHFTGYVIAKATNETEALEVAKAFEECVFRAPSLTHHDGDYRFMSEAFQAFAELMQSRSRATLYYRPQANLQQERSVEKMIQTVRAYVEDPLHADWDDIAEKIMHATNHSRDTTRRETPSYLVHGWDAQSTLKAMTSTKKRILLSQLTPHNGAEKLTVNERSPYS
ncbi:unnamed protein product [Phytophthora fragariaefolia]|uniref:Unnamed protein product n=1 Tax=Phytophthora fragariaefolia TaxID=1490495 RepID=A0A9W6XCQ9_9STRA|nr:unnamed protein product [Phytophthora fragariaefolia]